MRSREYVSGKVRFRIPASWERQSAAERSHGVHVHSRHYNMRLHSQTKQQNNKAIARKVAPEYLQDVASFGETRNGFSESHFLSRFLL